MRAVVIVLLGERLVEREVKYIDFIPQIYFGNIVGAELRRAGAYLTGVAALFALRNGVGVLHGVVAVNGEAADMRLVDIGQFYLVTFVLLADLNDDSYVLVVLSENTDKVLRYLSLFGRCSEAFAVGKCHGRREVVCFSVFANNYHTLSEVLELGNGDREFIGNHVARTCGGQAVLCYYFEQRLRINLFGLSAQRKAVGTDLAEISLIALVQSIVIPVLCDVDLTVEVRVVGHIGVFDGSFKLNRLAVLVVERFPDSLFDARGGRSRGGLSLVGRLGIGCRLCFRLRLVLDSLADDIRRIGKGLLHGRSKSERLADVSVKSNYL